ncbi:MAG: hypothetical protein KDD64_16525 [Bdellovibrionales bacterium]|nr:hypothetical protein [Bdellovibrionales bacterium]
MEKFYVPYVGGKPAAISINGHRMVIASLDEEALDSDYLGVVDILEVVAEREFLPTDFLGTPPESAGLDPKNFDQEAPIPAELREVADSVESGVLVIPENMTLDSVISHLESELPWIQ